MVRTVVQGLHAGRQQVSQHPPEPGERVVKFHFLLFCFFSALFTLCDCKLPSTCDFYVKIAIVKWLSFA